MAKVSVCVLTYGNYLELAKRCLGSILQHFPRDQYRLLVGGNALGAETIQYLTELQAAGAIDTLILSENNINKCPMMRRLFAKVETEFIWWFDDDSWVTGPETFAHWMGAAESAPATTAMWGHVFFFSQESHFNPQIDNVQWVRDALWYCGKEPPSWKIGGKGVTKFEGERRGDGRWFFATGGCWLIRKQAVDFLDWPDSRLIKSGDDTLLCEAIRQQGWTTCDLHGFGVKINEHARRGEDGSTRPNTPHATAPSNVPAKPKPVEVVILNWRRPQNVRRIVRAFAAQREHCSITLIDSAAGTEFGLDQETLKMADRYFIFSHNFGSFNRFVPILGYEAEFTLFQDDDLLPGPRAITRLLQIARENPRFAVLGEYGRGITLEGREVVRDARRFQRGCRRVDFLVRTYFVRTIHLRHFFNRCVEMSMDRQHSEDDLLLCASLQQMTGWPCLVTPLSDPDESLASESLPEPHALWHRNDHFHRRASFIQKLLSCGWKPLAKQRTERQDRSRATVESPRPS